jgi:hypothetical protein
MAKTYTGDELATYWFRVGVGGVCVFIAVVFIFIIL